MMAGYKCVNFADLCRLCASSGGARLGIFTDEGRRKKVHNKITESLRISIQESDRLPKSVCNGCLRQVEAQVEFRDAVVRAQSMLESCLNSPKLKNGGKVYIKDEKPKEPAPVISAPPSIPQIVTSLPVANVTKAVPMKLSMAGQKTVQAQPGTQIVINNNLPKATTNGPVVVSSSGNVAQSVTIPTTATIMAPGNNFLSSIMQAVGITTDESNRVATLPGGQQQQQQHIIAQPQLVLQQQPQQQQQQQQQHQQQQNPIAQYTITLDGQTTLKANNVHYKLQNGTLVPTTPVVNQKQEETQQTTFTQVDEFIKIKAATGKPQKRESQQVVTSETTPVKKQRIIQFIKPPVNQTPPKATLSLSSTPTVSPIVSSGSIVCATSTGGGPVTSTPLNGGQLKLVATGNNKCLVPIVVKNDASGETASVGNGTISSVPANGAVQFVQMKVEAGPDGVLRFAPAHINPQLTITPQTMPAQYGMQTTTGQSLQPTMTIVQNQNQPSQQPLPTVLQATTASGQTIGANYVTLMGKPSPAPQTQPDANVLQPTNVVLTTQAAPPQGQQQQTQVQPQQHRPQPPKTISTTSYAPAAGTGKQVVNRVFTAPPAGRKGIVVPAARASAPRQAPATAPKATQPTASLPRSSKPPTAQVSRSTVATAETREVTVAKGHTQTRTSNASSADSDSGTEGVAGAEEETAFRTTQSIMASQQMTAISAMSSKQDQTEQVLDAVDVSITTCDVCHKVFGRKEHLVQHLKSHIGLRPFKCEASDCLKTFSRKEHLLRHMVSHTGKKMFNCDMCQKLFSRKDNLNKHKKTHVDQKSAPFTCSICNTDFFVKSQYVKHKAKHAYDSLKHPSVQLSVKKDPPTATKAPAPKTMAPVTVNAVSQPVQAKVSQPLPNSNPITSIATAQPTVVQSLPVTITHTPNNGATIQLPTFQATQQMQQLIQQQPTAASVTTIPQTTGQPQQIFTIPAHINGKQVLHHLQIALPSCIAQQQHTVQTQSSTVQTLTATGGGGVTTLASLGGARATIINTVDGNTMFTIPSNLLFDSSQLIATSRQS